MFTLVLKGGEFICITDSFFLFLSLKLNGLQKDHFTT